MVSFKGRGGRQRGGSEPREAASCSFRVHCCHSGGKGTRGEAGRRGESKRALRKERRDGRTVVKLSRREGEEEEEEEEKEERVLVLEMKYTEEYQRRACERR